VKEALKVGPLVEADEVLLGWAEDVEEEAT